LEGVQVAAAGCGRRGGVQGDDGPEAGEELRELWGHEDNEGAEL